MAGASASSDRCTQNADTSQGLAFDAIFDWGKYNSEMSQDDIDDDGQAPDGEILESIQTGGGSDEAQIEGADREPDVGIWKSEEGMQHFLKWQDFLDLTTECGRNRLYAKARRIKASASEYFVTHDQVFPEKAGSPMATTSKICSPMNGVLTEMWKENSEVGEEDKEDEIVGTSSSCNLRRSRQGAKRKAPESFCENPENKKKQAYPSPLPSGSSDDDEDENKDPEVDFNSDSEEDPTAKIPHRKGHQAGYDRKTGKMTLVGTFPPRIMNGYFYCRDALCNELNTYKVQSQNGYKYHLRHVCLGNPNSERSLKRAAEFFDEKIGTVIGFSQKCDDCGRIFRSETGFRKHREENPSTKNGKCSERRRRIETGNSAETAITLAEVT